MYQIPIDNLMIFFGAIAYIGILIILLIKRGFNERIVQYFIVYILISFGLDLIRVLYQVNLTDPNLDLILYLISIIGLIGASVLLLKICELILPLKSVNRFWLILGLIWTAGIILFATTSYPDIIYPQEDLITIKLILNILAVIGWAAMMSRIVYLSFKSHRDIKRPLHKNRLIYWTISLLLIVIGDVFLFRNVLAVGSALHLAGVILISYILLTHNLLDIYRTSLQSLRYLMITVLAMLVYAILFVLLQPPIQELRGFNPLIGALIMAGILAFLVNPIVDLLSERINSLLLGMDYDPNAIMREYSQSISNIVDLKLLEQISMNLIKNTFGIDIGHLYIVEEITSGDNIIFQLHDIGEDEEEGVHTSELNQNDPIAIRFSIEKLPLTQYDLDYHPIYQKRESSGNRKFLSQAMDVYVPIHQNEHWIGLFALGAKTSGDRYYDEEIMLLETLADQSAVALENAKLFRRLQQINKELIITKQDLEEVNARLLEVDQLKSAFISVITHEMRTPLSNLAFSLQIFDMYGRENLTDEQQYQLEELHNGLISARRMIDNLVTFAAFLNNQVELEFVDLDIKEIVVSAMKPNLAVAEDKEIDMRLDAKGKNFHVQGDSKLLTEAIYHLINNAVKFTQDDGKIIISCSKTVEDYIIIVKDTGIGISNERMENIWDSFVSISNPLHRGWEGLGLGLALVKFIVQAHGGNVWAHSELGKGSEFGFQIPLAD